MAGWHHRLSGHEFEQAPGDGEGQGGLACCSPWGRRESDTTERLNSNKPKMGLLWWFSDKESACQAGHAGFIPGSGRSPGEGNGNSLQ